MWGHICSLADMQRIAARYFSPEAAELMVLPASDASMLPFAAGRERRRISRRVGTDSRRLTVVDAVGIEPTTCRLRVAGWR
jgi:hypothetical protein